ncbi:MAG: hypothetical protein P4L50_07185 [Anaerolineaceae bacterium]|nr:hypothetical protein [Anaerolineaceae bacterium]
MLKKACIFTLTIAVAVALSACSAIQSVTGAQSPTTQASGTGSQTGGTGASGTNAQITISPETRYAIGILKLQGTALAVTKDQATTLLPLWKAMLSLSSSNTTAPAEIQALQDQIKGSLSADQVTSIEKLDLSGTNMRTIMSSLNIQFGNGGTRSTLTPAQRQAFAGGGGGGGFPGGGGGGFPGGGGGGFPGGGGGFPGGGAPGAGGTGGTGSNSTSTRPTPIGGYAARARSAVNPMFVNAVINVLEKDAGLPTSTPFFRGPGQGQGTPNPTGQPNATSVPGSANPTSTPAPATSTTPGS